MSEFVVDGRTYRVNPRKMDPFVAFNIRRFWMPVLMAPIVETTRKGIFDTPEEELAYTTSQITKNLNRAMADLPMDHFNYICDGTLPFVERQIEDAGTIKWNSIYPKKLTINYADITETAMWVLVRKVIEEKLQPF